MASFTAKDVKELREKTGIGMMDCKKALADADGDMEKAIVLLRERGMAVAEKKASRIAAEGIVLARVDEDKKVAGMVEVNSETDFVSKNEDFQVFVNRLVDIVINENPTDMADFNKKVFKEGTSVEEELREKILVIGENLTIRRFKRVEGNCVSYVHGGGRIGVIVRFETEDKFANSAEVKECGANVSMQVAALAPKYFSKSDVPVEDVETEKIVLKNNIEKDEKSAKKPPHILEKMLEGRIGKFFQNNCLLEQEYVRESGMSVAEYVASVAKNLGGKLELVEAVRFEKGEGLEKKQEDFADEVANMIK